MRICPVGKDLFSVTQQIAVCICELCGGSVAKFLEEIEDTVTISVSS
jgi:hypothetical protein